MPLNIFAVTRVFPATCSSLCDVLFHRKIIDTNLNFRSEQIMDQSFQSDDLNLVELDVPGSFLCQHRLLIRLIPMNWEGEHGDDGCGSW